VSNRKLVGSDMDPASVAVVDVASPGYGVESCDRAVHLVLVMEMISARWAVARTADGRVTGDDIGFGVGKAAVVGEGEIDSQLRALCWEVAVDKKVASYLEKGDPKEVRARTLPLQLPEVWKIS